MARRVSVSPVVPTAIPAVRALLKSLEYAIGMLVMIGCVPVGVVVALVSAVLVESLESEDKMLEPVSVVEEDGVPM